MTDDMRRHLEELKGHLEEAADGGDDDAREVLAHVTGYLERAEHGDDDPGDLRDRLSDAVLRFELNHPKLSHTLQGVVDSLTASGI